MGFDLERFKDEVSKDLICSICTGVLSNAVITPECEHVFCRACILDWLNVKQQCPIDNSALKPEDVRSVPRIYKNFLGALLISCNYASSGCSLFVKLDDLEAHVKECAFNPTALVPCEKNCGMSVLKGALADHNCVQELRKSLNVIKMELTEEHSKSIKLTMELKQELNQLKKSLAVTSSQISGLENELRLVKTINQEAQKKRGASEPQLIGDCWKEMKAFIHFNIYSAPSLYGSYYGYNVGNDKDLLQDFHKFVLCRCTAGCEHFCGIQKLQGYTITYRYFTANNEKTNLTACKYCFILKRENTHIPDNLFRKCGYALITNP